MIKFIDLSFHVSGISLKDCIIKYRPSYGYTAFLQNRMDVEVIMHFEKEQREIVDGVTYTGLKGKNGFFNIPFNTLRYIRKQKPDVILVQGLLYPLQVIFLKAFLWGTNSSVIAQHHKETPYENFLLNFIQRLSDRYIQKYLFTSVGNLKLWQSSRIIKNESKVSEVLEGSTLFSRLDKRTSKHQLDIGDGLMFLWIGRLNENKDPLTIIKGFEAYVKVQPHAKLYMIYQTEELLSQIENYIAHHEVLKNAVCLVGSVQHQDIQVWLSAADYFMSGSFYEGSGYALVEAMACGCIPVVTDIPPFRKITCNGKYGILFKPGDANDLLQKLNSIEGIDREHFSGTVVQYFNEQLSFRKIADDIFDVAMKLKNN